jgi:pilus assembly protein CpaF
VVSSNGLLPQVKEYLLAKGVPVPPWRASNEDRARFQARVAQALVEMGLVTDNRITEEAPRLARMMTGLGVLDEIVQQPGVEEVMVRGGHVLVERNGRIETLGQLATEGEFEEIARRAADLGGRTMKADRPFVLVDLPDGSRFTAMIPPLSVNGTAINVRVFSREHLSLFDLAETGTFSVPDEEDAPVLPKEIADLPPAARFLAELARRNAATILISGEFSSGKTTLLNALTGYVLSTTVMAVIETFQEIKVQHPYVARAVVPDPPRETFPSLSEVVNVLYTRMRPDLIVFGEVVGNEAAELLAAINLGKKVWTTIHGNSAYDALLRLEDLAQSPWAKGPRTKGSGLSEQAIKERIGRGIDVVAHFRKGSWRYLERLVVVDGVDSAGHYRLRTLYDARTSNHSRAEELAALWDNTADTPQLPGSGLGYVQLPGETPAESGTDDVEALRRLFSGTTEEETRWRP